MPRDSVMTARRIAALIKPEAVCLDLRARGKIPALEETAMLLAGHPAIVDLKALAGQILAREQTGNTALGHGVALPHARTDLCRDIVVAVGRSFDGIDYGAPDGQPVWLIILIATPMQQVTEYLRVVGTLARLLAQERVQQTLQSAQTVAGFIAALAAAEG